MENTKLTERFPISENGWLIQDFNGIHRLVKLTVNEGFLAVNVKKDILEPKNLRKAKDNLTREERSALGKLKFSNNVFRIQDKGSRFVIISQNEYQDKMLGQLSNDLHYNKLNYDPTIEHFEKVKNWGRKWFSEGQISQQIATWVANLEPKPGMAFGNLKTHKESNPLRLITLFSLNFAGS